MVNETYLFAITICSIGAVGFLGSIASELKRIRKHLNK